MVPLGAVAASMPLILYTPTSLSAGETKSSRFQACCALSLPASEVRCEAPPGSFFATGTRNHRSLVSTPTLLLSHSSSYGPVRLPYLVLAVAPSLPLIFSRRPNAGTGSEPVLNRFLSWFPIPTPRHIPEPVCTVGTSWASLLLLIIVQSASQYMHTHG